MVRPITKIFFKNRVHKYSEGSFSFRLRLKNPLKISSKILTKIFWTGNWDSELCSPEHLRSARTYNW